MKTLRLTLLSLWLSASLFMVGCAALDKATGFDPKTGQISQTAPINTATNILGAILSPLGFGWISSAVLAASHVYAEVRAKNWKTAAIATAQGVQNVVSDLDSVHSPAAPVAPSVIADKIKAAIDASHDDHGVVQSIQTALTPTT